MSATCQCAVRSCARSLRNPIPRVSIASVTRSRRWEPSNRKWQTTETTTSLNPKIAPIVDQISQLTLLEVADLTQALKTKLNIPDIPIGGFSAAAPGASAAANPAAEPEEEAAAAPQEKTLFSVTLESIDASAKPKIIKEVKSMLGLSLVDSKKFVESVPKLMKESVPKEEAEKIVETLKALGGKVKME